MEINKNALELHLIRSVVCEFFHLTPEELNAKTRRREIVEPRQIYHYLGRKLTKCSLREIAFPFDHTTAIYSCKNIENLKDVDKVLRVNIQIIQFRINNIGLENYHSEAINFINYRDVLINKILKCKNKEEVKNIFV